MGKFSRFMGMRVDMYPDYSWSYFDGIYIATLNVMSTVICAPRTHLWCNNRNILPHGESNENSRTLFAGICMQIQ